MNLAPDAQSSAGKHTLAAALSVPVVAVVAAVVYSVFSVHRHQRFGSGSWDHGCYLHNAWLFAHGKAFSTTAVSSVLNDAAFWGGTNHFMPSLIFTAPLAWIMEASSSTSLLLVAQALVVCAAVLPLAAIARARGLPTSTTTALCVVFVFHMGTQAALMFDVHEIAPVPLLLFTVLWIVETKNRSRSVVVVVVVLLLVLGGCKESALAYAGAVGALLVFRKGWRDVGAVMLAFFLFAFFFVLGVVQPAFLEEGSLGMIHVARFSGAASPFASTDVKLTTIAVSAAGFGFLSVFSGEAVLLALPNLAERFVADKREMWGLGFHYGLVGAAYLAWGALCTLARLRQRWPGPRFDGFATVFLLVSMSVSFAVSPSAPDLATFDKPYYANDSEVARYQRALAHVDDDDAVVAQNHFLPHVALREHIWLPEQRFVERADVVVLDTAASPWPHNAKHVARLVSGLTKDPTRFEVVFHEDTTWVFRRRPST
ncbi:MAG: DUF2079 domain-containing protein [Deltaproteobacteria bacterium]|nr:DUF2079 domain-containing protein [Deltaproteobacteria bacterium]